MIAVNQDNQAIKQSARVHIRWQTIALLMGIFVLALLPRLTYQTLLTYDEANHWLVRTELFHTAIANGDWAGTLVAYHPGVTTTWLSATGLTISNLLFGENHATENLLRYIAVLRVPLAVFHAVCIVIGFLFLRRLFDARVALLASLFWAMSPFIISQSQIIHTDAPVMSTSVLSFLAMLIAFRFDSTTNGETTINWSWLVLSGVLGGLAVLSKLNGWLITVIFAGIVLNARVLPAENRLRMLWRSMRAGVVWLGVALSIVFILWPVMWVNLELVFEDSLYRGTEIALSGHTNFYLGEVVGYPAFHFFIVTLFLRITPWTTIGILLGLYFAFKNLNRRDHRLILHLLFFILTFLVVLGFQPKKFDRYILPAYPIVEIIAAFGWVMLVERGLGWWRRTRNAQLLTSVRTRRYIWTTAAIAMLGFVFLYSPYFLLYYNPLFGGARVAENLVLIGWGEGLGEAAAFIHDDADDVCEIRVASSYPNTVMWRHFPPCTAVEPVELEVIESLGENDYVVLYVNDFQRYGESDANLARYLQNGTLIHTVTVHGIDMAYVYEGTMPPQSDDDNADS